jgi:hypothetical protein
VECGVWHGVWSVAWSVECGWSDLLFCRLAKVTSHFSPPLLFHLGGGWTHLSYFYIFNFINKTIKNAVFSV